jgi:putative ABC transport system ATP-binding protein
MSNPGIVRMDRIGHIYAGDNYRVIALKNIRLSISKGEYIALIGPSGSGKTTLLHIMGCLLNPTCGTYFLTQQNVVGLRESRLARIRNKTIGFVFQNFNLLPRASALQNVALPLFYSGIGYQKRKLRAEQLLSRVGLTDRLQHHPGQLSGGEKQRVAIARALINHPALLLADEPTGNLDRATGRNIIRLFETLVDEGITVVIVTHDQDIVKRASRRIGIEDSHLADS